MEKARFIFILIFTALITGGCNTSKNIPEGSFLLDDMSVKTDNKVEGDVALETFVRQDPNSSLPLLGKVRLGLYNASSDSTGIFNKILRKIGQPPVIYSTRMTTMSRDQLKQELNNRGYWNSQVDTLLNINNSKNKIKVTYNIHTGAPYRIQHYRDTLPDSTMQRFLALAPFDAALQAGDRFDAEALENESSRISTILRNVGYYTFSKDYVYFKADTTLNSDQVKLYLDIRPAKDSLPYPRYKINNVTVISGSYATDAPSGEYFRYPDTTEYKGMKIIRGRRQFLRNSTIYRNNLMRKGMYYSDFLNSLTFQSYNSIGAISNPRIAITPIVTDSSHLLDVTITLPRANAHWFRAELDGTNSAGDIGVAPSVSYQHQNLFNGGEQLSIKLKGAYEFITGSDDSGLNGNNYYEYGIDFGLTLPQIVFPWLKRSLRERPASTTRFSVGLTNQHRSEFTRQFFNGTINYGTSARYGKLRHSIDFVDINYVRMPWTSTNFYNTYMSDTTHYPLLRESYKNQLVVRNAYSFTFVSGKPFRKNLNPYTIRGGIEVSGAIPRLVGLLGGTSKNESGKRQILGVQYAEYVKGNIDYSRALTLSPTHTLAYHAGIGIAYPYGNSDILPYERRFFAGGANSVRGWTTRALGPGAYNGKSNFVNQTGDIKLELSIESRHKISELFEIAGFVDAGNVWTIKNYTEQPGGEFEFSSFYKEIGVAYGMGLRFDLGFLLLRLDGGIRAYDPGEKQSDRFVLLKPRASRMALHFGIGYPF